MTKSENKSQRAAFGHSAFEHSFVIRISSFVIPRMLVFICALLFLASSTPSSAQDLTSAFQEANQLFEQQKFPEAAEAYRKMLRAGHVSSAIYFNLGNACFKAGQTGCAIAAYRKAGRLAPRDPDIYANLQFARDRVQNSSPPKIWFWNQWLDKLTPDEWTILAASIFWFWFLLLILGQWKPAWKRGLRLYTTVFGLTAVVVIACTALAAQRQIFTTIAVVVVDEAVVRRGPFSESQSAFSLRDGVELIVLDRQNKWVQVTDNANRIGWLPEQQLLLVR